MREQQSHPGPAVKIAQFRSAGEASIPELIDDARRPLLETIERLASTDEGWSAS
jgi:hypothetical protein